MVKKYARQHLADLGYFEKMYVFNNAEAKLTTLHRWAQNGHESFVQIINGALFLKIVNYKKVLMNSSSRKKNTYSYLGTQKNFSL